MGLFRKKTVKADAPTTPTTASTTTTPALASTPEVASVSATPALPPRAATPEQASTAVIAEEPHALSTDHAVDADAHQREVEAKEADQQRELDADHNRDSLAGGSGGLGSAAVIGGGGSHDSYPQEKAASPLSNGETSSYPAEKIGAGETSPVVHDNGVQDDGMMKGFVPVPAGDHLGHK